KARVEASLKGYRGLLTGANVTKGVGVQIAVSNVELRDGTGPPLAAIDEIFADYVNFVPATGSVRIHTLEIGGVRTSARRVENGWRVAGITLIRPAPSPPVADADPPAALDPKAIAEKRIDRLLASGIDVSFLDDTTQPPTAIPLSGLDVDVRNLTNLALVEPIP